MHNCPPRYTIGRAALFCALTLVSLMKPPKGLKITQVDPRQRFVEKWRRSLYSTPKLPVIGGEMNNAPSTETCAHTPCKCPARSDDEYCSTHCRSAAGGAETKCSCGHPECL